MPPLSSTTGRSEAADRKIRRKKKARIRKAQTRPAPVHQPGPFTDAERRKVEHNRSTPKYQKAIRAARKHGPATRRGTGPGEAKGDAEFTKGQEYVRRQYLRYVKGDKRRLAPDRGFYKKGTTVPPDIRSKHERKELVSRTVNASAPAPVLKVLEQTTRPLHGIAAGTRAAIHGKNVVKAAGRGFANKDKSTFSDVLKDVGAPKIVQSVGGFALDVAADPTTYVTLGTASVARKAAADAAEKATAKAVKAGLSKEQAKRMGERAAKQTLKKAGDKGRGATVRFAGHEAPGVRRGTATVSRVVRRATDKRGVKSVKDKARHVAADFNPAITPDNIARESYREARRATRTARNSTAREVAKTKERAVALHRKVKGADREILDAIESGSFRHLSPEKRDIAKRLRDQFKYARRLERRAGIGVKERKGYVPHALAEPLAKGEGIRSVGAKTIKPSFSKARKEQRTLKELRTQEPGKYSEDAALLYANRIIESHIATNKARLNRRLLDMGRRVRRGDEVTLHDGEKVFRVVGSNIKPVEKAELQRFIDTGDGGKGGQYVILNEQTVDHSIKNVVPAADRGAVGKLIDRGQGGWKWLATVPNPGFHVRNLVGDAQNAYLAESGHGLVANTVRSARTLKRIGVEEEHIRKALPGTPAELKGKGVKVAGKTVSYHDLIREAEQVGAIRSGFINRELPELGTSGNKGLKKIRTHTGGHVGRSFKRFIQNREDLFRLATYIGGRNRGLSPEKAAERAAHFHFDYADLTPLERNVMRRVMPFYTFSARNIPLQLTSFFARPGKFSQYQKIREETAKAFGINLDQAENNMQEYEQRSAPVVVKWKGKQFSLSFGPSGLPLTDLNEMPVTANPVDWADEWLSRGMSLVTPIIKTPVELWANFSFFFRDQIERETGPLVAAPSFVAQFPDSLKKKLGIVPDYVDKRTGKKTWAWPAKVDYISHILPGPANYLNRVLTPSDSKQQSVGAKTLAYAGVRVTPVDGVSKRINDLYRERSKLGKQRSALNQRGMSAEHPTAEWTRVNKRYNEVDKEIARLRGKRGDKIVPRRGRPPGVEPVRIGQSPASSSASRGRVLDLGGSSSTSSSSSGRVLDLGGGSSSGSSGSSGGRVLNLP